MADVAPAPAGKGFSLSKPGMKEYLIIGGIALLAGYWYFSRQKKAAAATTAASQGGAATPADTTGASSPQTVVRQGGGGNAGALAGLTSALQQWMQNQQSSPSSTGGNTGGPTGSTGGGSSPGSTPTYTQSGSGYSVNNPQGIPQSQTVGGTTYNWVSSPQQSGQIAGQGGKLFIQPSPGVFAQIQPNQQLGLNTAVYTA